MTKRNVVSRDDYELYSIPLPFPLTGARRRAYIARELEKMHPRFSSRCAFDTHLGVRRRRLVASVAVMDSVTLAAYRSRSRGRLFLGERKSRPVFCTLPQKIAPFAAAVLLAAAFACVLGVSARHEAYGASSSEAEQAVHPEAMRSSSGVHAPEAVGRILSFVGVHGGSVVSLSCASGAVRLLLQDTLPDGMGAALGPDVSPVFSDISYHGNVPSFSVEVPVPGEMPSAGVPAPDAMRVVREACTFFGGALLSENAGGSGASLSVPASVLVDFLSRVSAECGAQGLDFGSFSCDLSGSQTLLSFSFSALAEHPSLLDVLAGFQWSTGIRQHEEREEDEAHGMVPGGSPPGKPVGKIRRGDGRAVVFYSASDGSIKGVVE